MDFRALLFKRSRHQDVRKAAACLTSCPGKQNRPLSASTRSSISMRNHHDDMRNQQRSGMPCLNFHARLEPNQPRPSHHHPWLHSSAIPPHFSPIRLPPTNQPTNQAGRDDKNPPPPFPLHHPNPLTHLDLPPSYIYPHTQPSSPHRSWTFLPSLRHRGASRRQENNQTTRPRQACRHSMCSLLEPILPSIIEAINRPIPMAYLRTSSSLLCSSLFVFVFRFLQHFTHTNLPIRALASKKMNE